MENESKILKKVSRKSKKFQIELKDFNQFQQRDDQFSHIDLLVENTQTFVSNLFDNHGLNNNKENLPIILTKNQQICSQTLVKECINYQIKNCNKNFRDIFLPIFINHKSPENSAFYVIYQILIKLRKIFDIRKRINLSQENLRINFYIWLLMTSKKLQNSNHYDGDLYIIIDNAHLIEEKQKQQVESILKFWVPKNMPNRVKIILTLKEDSHNLQYFKDIQCKIFNLQFCQLKTKKKIRMSKKYLQDLVSPQQETTIQTQLFEYLINIDSSVPVDPNYYQYVMYLATIYFQANQDSVHKYAKSLLNQMNIFDFIINQSANVDRINHLIKYILRNLNSLIEKDESFNNFCFCLSKNLNFIKQSELIKISKIDLQTYEAIKIIFHNCIVQNCEKVKIMSCLFKENIESYLSTAQIQTKSIYKKMVQIFKKRSDSINKQEEIAYFYYKSNELFFLKQRISRIDNFIVLYNENSKYNLFRYWKILEEKGYDPVHEYNKSLELFDMHYNLQDNEIFFLSSQLSLFFKELSEFESKITPKFRHPVLKNKILQNKVKLYEKPTRQKIQISLEQIFNNSAQSVHTDPLDKIYQQYSDIFKQQEIVSFIDNLKIEDKNNEQLNYLDDMGILNELTLLDLVSNQNNNTQPHELLNLEIESNRKKFVNFFIQDIDRGVRQKLLDTLEYSDQQDHATDEEIENNLDKQKFLLINQKKQQKDFMSSLIDNIDLKIEQNKEPVFYYYKRWIWMNFPFMCLSKQDTEFSVLMSYCYTDLCNYLPYQQVQNFYYYCRCIIDNLKNKKKNILKPQIIIQQDGKTNKNISLTTPMFACNLNRTNRHNDKKRIRQQNFSYDKKEFNYSSNQLIKKKDKKIKAVSLRKVQDKDIYFQYKNYNTQNSQRLQKTLNETFQSQKKHQKNLSNKIRQIYMYSNQSKQKKEGFPCLNNSCSDIYNKYDGSFSILDQKNLRLQQELNKIHFQNRDLKNLIVQVNTVKTSNDQQLIQRKIMKSEIYERNQNEITMLKAKIEQMQNRLKFVEQKQFRYQEIIDICQINQIQNENTIKNLNYYLRNLQKIKKQEQKKQLQNQKKATYYQNASLNVFKNYQETKNVIQKQMNIIQENINKEIEINNIVQNSNNEINKEIKNFIEKKQESIVKKQVYEENKKIDNSQLKKEIDIEYSQQLEEFYKKYQYVFEDKENVYQQNWHEQQKFKKTIFLLQRRKSIQVFQKELNENFTNVNK